jgi:citryl-CoA synthetase large subunit
VILYEFEGKELLKKAGIKVPDSVLVESQDQEISVRPPMVLKAQVLSGKRADEGGIIMLDDPKELTSNLEALFSKTINNEKVEKILIEEKVDIEKEYYLSISYSGEERGAVLSISEQGGTGIEDRKVSQYNLNALSPTTNLPDIIDSDILEKAIELFFSEDCLLLEINPLVVTKSGQWVALDAKVKLEDNAKSRHPDWNYPARSVPGHNPTDNEIEAKKIDEGDYRGTAGAAYFDLPGDIAVLSSGGGVSLTALDALIASGGKPANFTEYSGNPPKEKVTKLTKIVLDKPNIHGLWVIGTVVANFTDIYETLSGLIEGLREAQNELGKKFDFPIVIRRGGPRDEEAFEMLKEVKDFDLILEGPETSIAESAKVMSEKAKEYATSWRGA